MDNTEKYTRIELALLALVVVIMLYFPYRMILEHQKDAVAAAYYKK